MRENRGRSQQRASCQIRYGKIKNMSQGACLGSYFLPAFNLNFFPSVPLLPFFKFRWENSVKISYPCDWESSCVHKGSCGFWRFQLENSLDVFGVEILFHNGVTPLLIQTTNDVVQEAYILHSTALRIFLSVIFSWREHFLPV